MPSLMENLLESFTENLSSYLPKIISVVVILVVGYIIIKILTKLIVKFFDKVDFDRTVETFIENLVKVALWLVLIIVLLGNLGVNVSGLIAGLGIMGFVVGFALKDTLGNLASGIFILFYKPFKVHDWVKIGGVTGEVIRIGIAACELKEANQTKVTIPNNKIWGDIIENFTGNKYRKMYDLEIGISYDSNIDKAIKIINDILKKDKRVLKEPAPQVVVRSLGDNSVNISVRPSTNRNDYWSVYFDTIKKVKEEFDKAGISIPFPQRDIWIKEMPKGKKRRKK